MEYKGFLSEIRYDKFANNFDGMVIGASQDIAFTGNSISELESNFKAAVEKHIAKCEMKKIDPYRSFSGTLILRFPDHTIHRDCALEAQRSGMSLNKWILSACSEKLRRSR